MNNPSPKNQLMGFRFLILGSCLILTLLSFSQKKDKTKEEKLEPIVMLGYVDFREANIWVMNDDGVNFIQYWDVTQPDEKVKVLGTVKKVNNQFISDFKIGPLQPGTTYQYKLLGFLGIGDKDEKVYKLTTPALWRYRTPPPDFQIAVGSCHYTNEKAFDRLSAPYGDTATEIFDKIVSKNPSLMIWGGDNIYLREPDWGSETGIYERYIHLRKQNGMKNLLSACPNVAIWDDHDFGPNDGNGSFANKEKTLKAFNDFWANPGSGMSEFKGITYAFDLNDVHFLMMDNRYHRTPDFCDSCQEETILGKSQLDWFKMNLLYLPADEFKVVCIGGQFLNTAKVYENHSKWEWERNDIIQFIYKHKIKNVVFITGDRHMSELSLLQKTGEPTIYDFTVSPLTSGVFSKFNEINANRVEGTLFLNERNFGIVQFVGKGKERSIRFILHDKTGNEVYMKQYVRE